MAINPAPTAPGTQLQWIISRAYRLLFIFGCVFILTSESLAQSVNGQYQPVYSPINGHHVDYTLPTGLPLLKKVSFYLTGGDGGSAKVDEHEAKGGRGATVEVTFNVGTEGGQILPGSTIRYMEGVSGTGGAIKSELWSGFIGGGGGGGSGIWYAPPGSNDFILLAVAGGGGGAFMAMSAGEPAPSTGMPGQTGQNGGKGRGTGKSGGTAGHGGGGSGAVAGGGGGAYSSGGKILSCGTNGGGGGAGSSSGGLGGSDAGCSVTWASGGSGVGGGGAAYTAGGGGGGYSGGGAGLSGGGGGGGSYVAWNAVGPKITENGSVSGSASDGEIYFKYTTNLTPIAGCRNAELELDMDGKAVLPYFWIDNASIDIDGVLVDKVLDRYEFTCNDLGEQTVVLTVTDDDNAMASCTARVRVLDKVKPLSACRNLRIQLDGSGMATITADQVNNGSSDNCEIDTMYLDRYVFTCADVGQQTVTLTVKDSSGNINTCTSQVTVEDNVPPNARCKNITIQLDAMGEVTITAPEVDNGSSDGCGIDTIYLDNDHFTCADVGPNTVKLTVIDVNGNESWCKAIVTVQDTVKPEVICQDITIELDKLGTARIVPFDIDGGSTDACGIKTIEATPINFTCADLGENIVTLKVTDVNGNFSTCDAVVTVVDPWPPITRTRDVTVVLDRDGEASVHPSMIDNGSSDNCFIVDMWLEGLKDYDCGDVGEHVVELKVKDQSGNVGTEAAVVTVEYYEPDFTNIHGVGNGDTVHLADCLPWPADLRDLLDFREMRKHGHITSHLYKEDLPIHSSWSMYELWRYEYRFQDDCYHTEIFTFYLALYDLAPPSFLSFPNDTIVATVADIPEVDQNVRIIDVCQYVEWDTVITMPVLSRNRTDTVGFTRRWRARDPSGHERFRDQMIWLENGNRKQYGLITGRIADENQILNARFAGEAGTNGIPISLFRIEETRDSLVWVDTWTTGDWQGAQGKYYFDPVYPGQYRVKIDSVICLVDTLKFDKHLWSDTFEVMAGSVIDQEWIITHPCVMEDTMVYDSVPTLIQDTSYSDPGKEFNDSEVRADWMDWVIYPNPATGYIRIRVRSDEAYTIRLYDTLGRLVKKESGHREQTIDVRGLDPGFYHIELSNRKAILGIKKVVVIE